jgi:hypothetical protein
MSLDATWSVSVERLRPESLSLARSILEAFAPSISCERVDRLIADHQGAVGGLSLEQANHLMLKLHEAGVSSSKRVEAQADTSPPSGASEDRPHVAPAAGEPARRQQDTQPSAPVSLPRRGGVVNATFPATLVGLVLLLGIGWYGFSMLNRSAGPASRSAPESPAEEPHPIAAMSKPGTWIVWSVMETYNRDALQGDKVGPPSVRTERPDEIDLDRAACELVKQSKVRAAQQRSAGDRLSLIEDGVIYHSGGVDRSMVVTLFYCVAAPKFPPGHDRK